MRNGNHRKSKGTRYLRQQWLRHAVTCSPDENALQQQIPGTKMVSTGEQVGTFAQGRFETNPSCLFPLAFHCFRSQP